jgi:hypothetical protein
LIKKKFIAKGIKLRKYRTYHLFFLTTQGKLTIPRMSLIASNPEGEDALSKLGYGKTVFPLDEYLHIDRLQFKMTVNTMLEIAYWAQSSSSFALASQQLHRAKGLLVNDETIRAVTSTVGKIVFENDVADANKTFFLLNSGKMEFPKIKNDNTLYLEVDGAMLHTREKNEEGSSYRENKLGIVFSSESFKYYFDKKTQMMRPKVGKREYRAYLGDVDNFKKHFFALALKNGYGSYKKTILISDGASWIRHMKEELFPDAQQILDYFHLCEKVSTFAKGIYDNDEAMYKPWTEKICTLLKNSRINEVHTVLEQINKKLLSKSDINLSNYLKNNKNNIDYKSYIQKGYFIGSGAIESANKSVLQQRLKQPGMRWNLDTGQHIITLMSKEKSGLWYEEVVNPILKFFA